MAHSSKKLIALDLDGTLLNAEHSVSKESGEKLRELCSLGIHVCIASGRSGPAMYHIIEALALPSESTFAVAYNGAVGFEFKKGFKKEAADLKGTVFESCIEEKTVEKTLEFARRNNLLAQVYIGDAIYVHCRQEEHYDLVRRYHELTGAHHTHITDNYANINKAAVYKILLMTDAPDAVLDTLKSEEPQLKGTLVRGAPPFFVEVLRHDVCKGNGLKLLCKHLNIPLEDVIAFGDGDNDYEFLQFAGLGIAMKNGRPRTLAIADRVTRLDHAQNGVADCLSTLQSEGMLPSVSEKCISSSQPVDQAVLLSSASSASTSGK